MKLPARVIRSWALVLAAGAAVAGCASATGGAPAGGGPLTSAPGSSAPRSDLAEIFAAAVTHRSRPEGRQNRPLTLIRDHTYCSQPLQVRPCAPVRIEDDVQRQVLAHLGPQTRFTAAPPKRLDSRSRIVVTLGAPRITGERATVTVETACGPWCAQGETLVLHRTARGWRVTGLTGTSYLS